MHRMQGGVNHLIHELISSIKTLTDVDDCCG